MFLPQLDTNPSVSKKSVDCVFMQCIFYSFVLIVAEESFLLFANSYHVHHYVYELMCTLPPLIGPLVQMASSKILQYYNKRVYILSVVLFLQSVSILLMGIVPFLPGGVLGNGDWQLPFSLSCFLVLYAIYMVTGHFGAPPWMSLMGDISSERSRGDFFGTINTYAMVGQIIAKFMVIALFAWLAFLELKLFVIFFLFAGIMRLASWYYVRQIEEVPFQIQKSESFSFWQFIKRGKESNFVKFTFFSAVLNGSAFIAGPFFLAYWTDDLQYSQQSWVIFGIGGLFAQLICMKPWGYLADKFGNKLVLKWCAIGISITPFFWMLSHNMLYLMIIQPIGMIFWTGFNQCVANYIFEAATPAKRPLCFSYYAIITGIAVVIGGRMGTCILTYMPKEIAGMQVDHIFVWVLLVSGVGRLIATMFLLNTFKELREVNIFNYRLFKVEIFRALATLGLFKLFKNK